MLTSLSPHTFFFVNIYFFIWLCQALVMAWALSSSVWLVGSFSCGMQDFLFLSCGMRDLVPWPGSSESYPLGPPGKSLPLIPSYLDTAVVFWLSLPLLQPAPFDSFFKILLERSSKKTYMAMLLPTKGFPVFPHSLLFPFLSSPLHPSYSPHPLSMSA